MRSPVLNCISLTTRNADLNCCGLDRFANGAVRVLLLALREGESKTYVLAIEGRAVEVDIAVEGEGLSRTGGDVEYCSM